MSSDIPTTSGIYRITCTTTGKFYIGSAINLQNRRRVHFHHLRRNTHHSITLQRAWNKYGEQAFIFEVVELVLVAFLIEREQFWLDTLLPFDGNGYNIDRVAGSRLGQHVSLETREKLRQANLGKKQSPETIRKITESNTGKTHNDATKEKVRLIRLGTTRSPETRERLRSSHLGKKQSEETKERRRIARLGYTPSADTRDKISESNITGNAWRMKTLIVTSPDGETFTIHGIGQFCKSHGLNRSALIQVAKGKTSHHKGWTARYP